MAFDRSYFTQMAYGGAGGNAVWHYYDVNADNVGSLAGSGVSTGYFDRAFTNHGIVARTGDVILITSVNVLATNKASFAIGVVPADWDSNGASVIINYGTS